MAIRTLGGFPVEIVSTNGKRHLGWGGTEVVIRRLDTGQVMSDFSSLGLVDDNKGAEIEAAIREAKKKGGEENAETEQR